MADRWIGYREMLVELGSSAALAVGSSGILSIRTGRRNTGAQHYWEGTEKGLVAMVVLGTFASVFVSRRRADMAREHRRGHLYQLALPLISVITVLAAFIDAAGLVPGVDLPFLLEIAPAFVSVLVLLFNVYEFVAYHLLRRE